MDTEHTYFLFQSTKTNLPTKNNIFFKGTIGIKVSLLKNLII